MLLSVSSALKYFISMNICWVILFIQFFVFDCVWSELSRSLHSMSIFIMVSSYLLICWMSSLKWEKKVYDAFFNNGSLFSDFWIQMTFEGISGLEIIINLNASSFWVDANANLSLVVVSDVNWRINKEGAFYGFSIFQYFDIKSIN